MNNTKLLNLNRIFGSSKIHYWKLLKTVNVLRFISNVFQCDTTLLVSKARKLSLYIDNCSRSETMASIAKRFRECERKLLHHSKYIWVSSKYFTGLPYDVVLILLSVHRNMTCQPTPDFSSINHQANGETMFRELISYHKDHPLIKQMFTPKFFYEHVHRGMEPLIGYKALRFAPYSQRQIDCNRRRDGDKYPFRCGYKSGPNGPAILTYEKDYCGLTKDPELMKHVLKLWSFFGFSEEIHKFENCHNFPDCSCLNSKLMPIQDKSCKTRIVAVLDSYSQTVLVPLAQYIQDFCKKILKNTDFTFDQMKGVQKLLKFSKRDLPMASIDLSNATDTLPFYIARIWMENHFPSEIVDSIEHILKNRDFKYGDQSFRYNAGQPMGAYGSFGLLSITNNLLFRLSCAISKQYCQAAIVGDDIVICNHKVAEVYKNLLNLCNTPWNPLKCIERNSSFEFCKKTGYKGKITGGISLKIIYYSIVYHETQILKLMYDLGKKLPSFTVLRFYFSRKELNSFLSRNEKVRIEFYSHVKVKSIPESIIQHLSFARNQKELVEDLPNLKSKKLTCSNPYLMRFNFSITVINTLYKNYQKLLKKEKRDKTHYIKDSLSDRPVRLTHMSFLTNYIKNKDIRIGYHKPCIGSELRDYSEAMLHYGLWDTILQKQKQRHRAMLAWNAQTRKENAEKGINPQS